MRFSRSRYVTLCQQSLVTAAVLAVGVSAAGVKTLDIVPQPGRAAGVRGGVPEALPQTPQEPRVQVARAPKVPAQQAPEPTKVDAAPVTPKVREVKVSGISTKVPGGTEATTASPAPSPEAKPAPNARLAPQPQTDSTKQLVALSEPQPVRGYATVGVTWKHGVDYDDERIDVQVRTEKNGTWSDWTPAEYHDEHGPDGAESVGAGERPGTDALVVGDVDRVQMRAETSDGSTPPDLKLAVIDPGTGTMVDRAPAIDTSELAAPETASSEEGAPAEGTAPAEEATLSASDGTDADTVALSAMKAAPKPYIYSRAQWGANERLREQSAPGYGTVKAGFIHHTVNANNYTAEQVPSLMRGIYAYHTQSRGWRDIGYNFLVDRFGRIWEGRWGGVDRAVVGAHTAGYNEVSFAMSAIGNFDIASPPQAVADAYARLFAWKLSLHNIRADASRVYVKNRYMQAINGHRDAGSTACPGRYLYAKLPAIRVATQKLQNAAQAAPAPAPGPAPAPKPGASTSDPKCTASTIGRASYRYTDPTKRTWFHVPLQCLLKQQRLYSSAVSGRWNPETTTAVHAFQRRVGHPVRSSFTQRDWVALLSAGGSGRTLTRGARGADVVLVQRALNAAGKPRLKITGAYGPRTRKALGAYQRRVGIPVTKVVASQTWAALRSGRM